MDFLDLLRKKQTQHLAMDVAVFKRLRSYRIVEIRQGTNCAELHFFSLGSKKLGESELDCASGGP